MIRCTVHWTIHHCTQYCGEPAKYGWVMFSSNAVYPSCEKHRNCDSWMKELGGKRHPIKKAIGIVESR